MKVVTENTKQLKNKCLVQIDGNNRSFVWQSTVCQLNSAVRLNLTIREARARRTPSQACDLQSKNRARLRFLMISLPSSIGLGLGILYRLSERSALTGLLPDFSYGIGFYGWPVLYKGLGEQFHLLLPLCKSAGRSGNFLFPIGSTLSVG